MVISSTSDIPRYPGVTGYRAAEEMWVLYFTAIRTILDIALEKFGKKRAISKSSDEKVYFCMNVKRKVFDLKTTRKRVLEDFFLIISFDLKDEDKSVLVKQLVFDCQIEGICFPV